MSEPVEARVSRELRPSATLQFKVEPERIPWIYSVLMNEPQVKLFEGEFPEPFTSLSYVAQQRQGQLMLTATFEVGPDFEARYNQSIGTPENLQPLLIRYPKHQFSPDGQQLVYLKESNHLQVY